MSWTTLLLIASVSLPMQAGIQNLSNLGIPLTRTDFSNIQLVVHSSVNPGARNKDGGQIFTPSSDPAGALRKAADAWSSVKTSAVKFAPFQSTTTLQANSADGINLVTAEETPENRSLVGSFLAVTVYSYNPGGQILDTDILINPAGIAPGGKPAPFSTLHELNAFDFLGTMTHEFGHALGAAHSPVSSAAMFQTSSMASQFVTGYETSSQSVLSADDAAFVSSVYPAPGSSLASITGTVRLDSGAAVRGALVIAVSAGGDVIGTLASLTDGSYIIAGVPPGSYLVYAQPMDGPVRPGNFGFPNIATANVSFRTTFAGGNGSAKTVLATGGTSSNSDISVDPLVSSLHIDTVGTGSAGGQDWSTATVKAITGGQSRDILLWGPGIDATITEGQVQLLSGGLTLRPGTLRPAPSAVLNGITAMRFTVDANPATVKTPVVILINKNGEAAASTGALFVIPAPFFSHSSIVNAASFKGGPVVPGEVITVFGTNFGPAILATLGLDSAGRVAAQLSDTLITFDNTAAPMIYSVNGQISAIGPYNVSGKTTSNVAVSYGGAVSAVVKVAVAEASPALFTLNASGAGPGAILNQDSTVNTSAHPAAQNSVVVLYGTGLGVVTPGAHDGEITPGTATSSQPVKVTIGGKDAKILYAGAAPSLVSGVLQINAQLPAGIGSGAVPIMITVGSASTPIGVTVFVE